MPVTATTTSTTASNLVVTNSDIRLFLRDKSEFNILLLGNIQFSDEEIEAGIKYACSIWNSLPPVIQSIKLDGTQWPEYIPHLLVQGTAAWLLMTEANKQVRNHLNSQDGNIPGLGIEDKQGQYLQHSSMLMSEFKDACARYKMLTDVERSPRKSRSPMSRIYRYGRY